MVGAADVRYRALDSATRSSTGMERPCNGDGVVSRNEYMNFGELNYLDADANDDANSRFASCGNSTAAGDRLRARG